jgi:hypothetical protein
MKPDHRIVSLRKRLLNLRIAFIKQRIAKVFGITTSDDKKPSNQPSPKQPVEPVNKPPPLRPPPSVPFKKGDKTPQKR